MDTTLRRSPDSSLLEVDATFAFEGGITAEALSGLRPRLESILRRTARELERGNLSFLRLAERGADAEAIQRWRLALPEFDDALVFGIGGSALGARAFNATRPDLGGRPRLHVVDTVDPEFVSGLLARLDPKRTVVVAVSLSGTTLETGATFLPAEAWLRSALGDSAAQRIAVVSGEDPNPLARRAVTSGYATFAIPKGVGGRFSALSPAGLLPAALVGVDPSRLLAGAKTAVARSLSTDLEANPAMALAALHYLAQGRGKSATVLWAYGLRLETLGPWWVQLVAESLGKRSGDRGTGVTPLAARGPADQHSLLQLILDGPKDKFTVFLATRADADVAHASGNNEITVPSGGEELVGVAGKTLAEILAAERDATEFALARAGRPSLTVRLRGADPESIAAFLMTYEAAVLFWGRLLRVDPFDQPAVGLGKTAALASLLGTPAEAAAEIAAHRGRPRRVFS